MGWTGLDSSHSLILVEQGKMLYRRMCLIGPCLLMCTPQTLLFTYFVFRIHPDFINCMIIGLEIRDFLLSYLLREHQFGSFLSQQGIEIRNLTSIGHLLLWDTMHDAFILHLLKFIKAHWKKEFLHFYIEKTDKFTYCKMVYEPSERPIANKWQNQELNH